MQEIDAQTPSSDDTPCEELEALKINPSDSTSISSSQKITDAGFRVFMEAGIEEMYKQALQVHDKIFESFVTGFVKSGDNVRFDPNPYGVDSLVIWDPIKPNEPNEPNEPYIRHLEKSIDAARVSLMQHFSKDLGSSVHHLLHSLSKCLEEVWRDKSCLNVDMHQHVFQAIPDQYRKLIEAVIVVRSAIKNLACAPYNWDIKEYKPVDRRPVPIYLCATDKGFEVQKLYGIGSESATKAITTVISMPTIILANGKKLQGRAHLFEVVKMTASKGEEKNDKDDLWNSFLCQIS